MDMKEDENVMTPEEDPAGGMVPEDEKDEKTDQEDSKKPGKKRPFLKGLLTGLGISAAALLLWRGYIDIPFGGYTLTIFMPTYYLGRIIDKDNIDYRNVERKMKEIDRYIDRYYYYEKDPDAMEEGAVAGLVYGLYEEDPYVSYFTADAFTDEMQSIEGNYCGIGVTVTEDTETGGILVLAVTREGPAEEAGLKEGDLIIGVDGEDIRGVGLNTATSQYIKGPEGSRVELLILRDGEELEISCERRIIETVSVHHSMVEYEGRKAGYICVSSFENNTDDQFDAALTELTEAGAEALVLDLRDDLGGSVSSAVGILDRILPDDDHTYADEENMAEEKGTLLFYQQDKAGERRYYYAEDGLSCDLPIVVLVNENSASASEIITGVLKDYGYKVVGMNTFGKGIIQSLIQLSDGSAVEFTTAEYLMPSGYSLHKKGIAPDVESAPDEVLLENGADMDAPDPTTDNQLRTALDTVFEN